MNLVKQTEEIKPSAKKERPILFTGEMVRAILAGRKTQTRRVVKPQPEDCIVNTQCSYNSLLRGSNWQVGARLWVRETFQPVQLASEVTQWRYAATDEKGMANWKPSIFMPRKASRITLEIEAVRVERLNAITEADALLEGVTHAAWSAVESYFTLWESINGNGSWYLNPWVWVLTFKRV